MNPDMVGQKNLIMLAVALAVLVIVVFGAAVLTRRRPRKLDIEYFTLRWKDLQKMCSDSATWPLAIIDADKLLDEALKRQRVRGKTMGERLVTVQRELSDNDAVWFAHKLRNKLVHEDYDNLKERDVKEALIGFRRALKDLGALK